MKDSLPCGERSFCLEPVDYVRSFVNIPGTWVVLRRNSGSDWALNLRPRVSIGSPQCQLRYEVCEKSLADVDVELQVRQ